MVAFAFFFLCVCVSQCEAALDCSGTESSPAFVSRQSRLRLQPRPVSMSNHMHDQMPPI